MALQLLTLLSTFFQWAPFALIVKTSFLTYETKGSKVPSRNKVCLKGSFLLWEQILGKHISSNWNKAHNFGGCTVSRSPWYLQRQKYKFLVDAGWRQGTPAPSTCFAWAFQIQESPEQSNHIWQSFLRSPTGTHRVIQRGWAGQSLTAGNLQ